MIELNPISFAAGYCSGFVITALIGYRLVWKRYRRLRDHAAYQDIKVVRIYRNGVLQSQTVEPVNPEKDDGTLPLPLEAELRTPWGPSKVKLDTPPGTRMSEIDERKN